MRKLFLLIPALVLSLILKAADQYPDPAVDNSLAAAVSAVGNNEIIYLDEGTYTNSAASDYTKIRDGKHITFKAIEGKNPVVQLKYPFQIRAASKATFIGIKFDGTSLSYDSYFLLYDATDNTWEFKDCEFTALSKYIISVSSDKKAASIVFDSCYFHDITKSCVLVDNTGESSLTVTNCTFANIDASAVSAGVVDSRTATGVVTVDHCTFYNCRVKNTDYGTVRVTTPNATVSNCIFAMPTSTDNLRTVYVADGLAAGTTVTHCLMHNYTKDSNIGIPSRAGLNKIECNVGDPLFNDIANNKYTYAGTYGVSMSPARGASTDGSDLGDPRWYTDVIYPSTNFAGGYTFTADKAELSGSILYETSGPNGPYLRYNAPDVPGTASWIIQATRACHVNVTVNMADNSWNQASDANYKNGNHIFGVELWDGSVRKDTIAEGEYGNGKQDGYSTYPTVNLGSIEIPAAGLYTVKLLNPRGWAKCGVESVTLTYQGGDVQSMPATTNINDAWFSPNGTRADGKISFPYGHMNEGWVMWNVAFANAANYKVTVNIENANGHNYTVGLYENESALTPIVYVSEGEQKSTLSTLDLGSMEVAAGNYVMKVTNETQYSDAKLISVKLEYLGGGTVNIPNVAIPFADAILSSHAFTDANGLHFADNDHLGHIDEEYAKWNIHAAGGIYRFVAHCSSTNWSHLKMRVLSGNTELYSFTTEYAYNQDDKEIKSPEWFLAAGDYVLELSNPAKHSNGYLKSLAATAAENIFIVDENETDADVIAGKAETSWKALLQRTFKGGVYNSFCIPVEPGLGELETAFGAGYELLELESATLDGGVLNLNFTTASSVSAGKPYLIKPVADVANPIFNAHNIHNYTGNNIQSVGVVDFIGNFVKKTIDASENNLYLGTDDKLYFSPNDVTIKGLRAYFKVNVPNPALAVKRARIVTPNNMPTEIDLVGAENQTLKTIENGQLIIFRDGKKYNVMGIKLQ